MSTDFLRYSPYLVQVPADFDRNMDLVLQGIDRYIPGTPSSEPRGKPEGRAVRATHAKSYGVAKAEVEVLGNLPPEYAQGIYAKPGRYGALARFSNGSPHLGMDTMLPRAMGLSVKIFGIEGPKLLEDEANSRTFDYSNINLPVFFCSTVEQYVVVQQLNVDQPTYMSEGVPGRNRLFRDFLTLKGTLSPDRYLRVEFSAFLRATALPPKNLLLFSYWTMGAVRHGDYVAKLRFAPTETSANSVVQRDLLPPPPPPTPPPKDVYYQALVSELQARPYEFDIQVQLSIDRVLMPIDNVSVEWPEGFSPFVTVGKLRLPQQDISSYDNVEAMDALSINPWRVTAEHAPLGEIQLSRKEAYRRSSILRHQINRQERREPQTPDEALMKAK